MRAEANSIIPRVITGYPERDMPAVPIVLGISATIDRSIKAVEIRATMSRSDVIACTSSR